MRNVLSVFQTTTLARDGTNLTLRTVSSAVCNMLIRKTFERQPKFIDQSVRK